MVEEHEIDEYQKSVGGPAPNKITSELFRGLIFGMLFMAIAVAFLANII